MRKGKKRKKQRTRWVYTWTASGGTYIKVGVVRNINTKKHPHIDVIRLQILSNTRTRNKKGFGDWYFSPDEAILIAAGFSHAVGWFLREFPTYRKWRQLNWKKHQK